MTDAAAYLEEGKAELRQGIRLYREGYYDGIRFAAWDKEEADALKAYMADIAPEIPFGVSWCDWDRGPPPPPDP